MLITKLDILVVIIWGKSCAQAETAIIIGTGEIIAGAKIVGL